MPLDGITRFCFGASYTAALILELVQLLRPRPLWRLLAACFGAAGLVAHTLFLVGQRPPLSSQFGSLLLLSWVLAIFYLYGSLHHRTVAWGIFVLPVVVGLVVLTYAPMGDGPPNSDLPAYWLFLHSTLLTLASVGVCIAFVASVMYLFQARRLRAKVMPGEGVRLLSLERLEAMNRRAINLAFPFLTAGVLIGGALMLHGAPLQGWSDPKVLGGVALWLVFALLLYLRYGVHLRGRRLAQLTIMAFVLLVFTLAASHSQ